MVGGLVVGSIGETATGSWNGTAFTDATDTGAVTLSTGMLNAVDGYETDYITDSESLQDNATLIIGLIAKAMMAVFMIGWNIL